MTKNTFSTRDYAVSEVIGALLLVVIAIGSFVAIYFYFLPVPFPSPDPHVQLQGYVTGDGTVVLEHMGGEQLNSYEIHVEQSDGRHTYRYENDPWNIGECYYPPINSELFNDEKEVRLSVYGIYEDGSTKLVFDGILTPEEYLPGPSNPPLEDPMLVSTLRTNTDDEDLICYSHSIEPNINPTTFIYNWMTASTGPYTPFTALLMPFDTQEPSQTKDYSGNQYNGTINGATWADTGRMGGAYLFGGDDFISIPYCFENDYIDTITVEAWIKTSLSSGTILSYNRNEYWELAVADGQVKWSTNASDGASDITGTTLVNDNTWHLIAATYNSSSGTCSISVDGRPDTTQQMHAPDSPIGSGTTPTGAIGKGTGIVGRKPIFSTSYEEQSERDTWVEHNSTGGQQQTWSTLRYDNFNAGWGSYTDGDGSGSDCYRSSAYKHEGTYSAATRDNSGTSSSFYLTNSIDVETPGYKSLKVDFWWMWNGAGWATGEDWFVMYNNGSSWNTVLDRNYPSGYVKDVWYHEIIYINESIYTFPTAMRLRFQCDASYDDDRVYFDQIYINATNWGRIECDFDRLPSTALAPRTDSYSIGGSGDFDPEYAAFNRTGITLSGYKEVQLSLWYSYKDTEDTDFFGLYYLNGTLWTPIFELPDPLIVGQLPWTYVQVNIPDSLDTIVLQFKWMTSSTTEYMAIDDLEITGLPLAGESNFTGIIDEVKIYHRALSDEQLYQNYLCTKSGDSTRHVIVAEETRLDEIWKCFVTPNDGTQDDVTTESNIVYIINYGGGG